MRLRIAALALLAVTAAGHALAQGHVIAERREGLRTQQATLEAVQAALRGGGDVRALVPRIEAAQAFFADYPSRFPEGSNVGDTRALPTVWTDRAGFETAWRNLLPTLATLRGAAASGDAAATGAALQATGGACINCHRGFRAR
jgi:cytochrome c556